MELLKQKSTFLINYMHMECAFFISTRNAQGFMKKKVCIFRHMHQLRISRDERKCSEMRVPAPVRLAASRFLCSPSARLLPASPSFLLAISKKHGRS
jgi:hypothetical protein